MSNKTLSMDSVDQHILSLLQRDGRMSFTDIGKETGLSTSAAQQRVLRLERVGKITGYTAIVADPMQLAIERVVAILRQPDIPSSNNTWTYGGYLNEVAAKIVRAVHETPT